MSEISVKEVVEQLLERVTVLENESSNSVELEGKGLEIYLAGLSNTVSIPAGETDEKTITFTNANFSGTPHVLVGLEKPSSSGYIERLVDLDYVVEDISSTGCTIYLKNNNQYASGAFNLAILAYRYVGGGVGFVKIS